MVDGKPLEMTVCSCLSGFLMEQTVGTLLKQKVSPVESLRFFLNELKIRMSVHVVSLGSDTKRCWVGGGGLMEKDEEKQTALWQPGHAH